MTTKHAALFFVLPLMLLAAGCTPPPSQTRPQPPVEEKPVAVPSPTSATEPLPTVSPVEVDPLPAEPEQTSSAPMQQSPAVLALLDQANSLSDQGNYRDAQGSLQRAQRIAPKDPDVYYALALTHMELENYSQAEQMALKGVSVAQGDNRQSKRMWTLIAKIRLRAGDVNGSQQAEQRAANY